MFCAKCGATVADGAKFCDVCGQPMAAPAAPVAPVAPAAPAYAPAAPAPVAAPKKSGLPVILIAVVAAVAVLLGCLLLFGGSACESAVDDYYALMGQGDLSVVEDLAPEQFWSYITGEYGVTLEQVVDNPVCVAKAQAMAMENNASSRTAYGADWEATYTVLCEHELGQAKLAAVQTKFAEKYGIPTEDVEELTTLHIQCEETGSIDEDVSVITRTAVKIDGNWYLIDGSFYKNGETGAELYDGDFSVASRVKTCIRAVTND